MEKELTYNTVIVGAGVSGLYAALKLPKEQNILLICKEDLPSCDSMLAQAASASRGMKPTTIPSSRTPSRQGITKIARKAWIS